jgi:hypothetical protein
VHPLGTVEVTEPTHPLYGLTLPLLEVGPKPRLGRACVVWLEPGVERLLPVAATNLGGGVAPPGRCRLSVAAARALVAAVASLRDGPVGHPEDADGPAPPAQPPGDTIPATADGAPAAARQPAAPAAAGAVRPAGARAAVAAARHPAGAPAGRLGPLARGDAGADPADRAPGSRGGRPR